MDENGREIFIYDWVDHNKIQVRYEKGILYNEDGSLYTGKNEYIKKVTDDLNKIRSLDAEVNKKISNLETNTMNDTYIRMLAFDSDPMTSSQSDAGYYGEKEDASITYNPDYHYQIGGFTGDEKNKYYVNDPAVNLTHEIQHAWEFNSGGIMNYDETVSGVDGGTVQTLEIRAINLENKIRPHTGDNFRDEYGGVKIPFKYLEKPNTTTSGLGKSTSSGGRTGSEAGTLTPSDNTSTNKGTTFIPYRNDK